MLTGTRLTCPSPVTSKLYNYTLFMQFQIQSNERLILRLFKALSFVMIYIVSSLNSYCSTSKGKTPYGLLRRSDVSCSSFPQIFYNKKSNNLITFMKHSINWINVGFVVYD